MLRLVVNVAFCHPMSDGEILTEIESHTAPGNSENHAIDFINRCWTNSMVFAGIQWMSILKYSTWRQP